MAEDGRRERKISDSFENKGLYPNQTHFVGQTSLTKKNGQFRLIIAIMLTFAASTGQPLRVRLSAVQ
jgi:hypothetical protein